MKRVLKLEYEELYNDWEDGCACHINPPCSNCLDEGNPSNLRENEEAWEMVENDIDRVTYSDLIPTGG